MMKQVFGILAAAMIAGLLTLPVAVLADGHGFDPDEPPPEGKGSVYGTVTARPHKDYVKKAKELGSKEDYDDNDPYAGSADGKVIYNDTMVNYDFADVYAILLNPAAKPGKVHEVEAEGDEDQKPRALAVAFGDIIRIKNATSKPLTYFLADINGDSIQEIPLLPPGGSADMTVELVGDLELTTDEEDSLITAVLSREGLQSQRVRSGSTYAFPNMNPGEYDLLFWFWRLGILKRKVTVEAWEHTDVDGVLSVDTVVR